MTVMATTTHAHPETAGARPPQSPWVPVGRRLALSAACYLGIAAMVVLTVLAARVLPTGVGVPLFVLGMAAVVAVAHPAIQLTHRSR